jgi:hypothetical protein
MMRRFLVPLIAFALPFLVFAVYRRLNRQTGAKAWPMAILFIAGAVLSVQAFALAALTEPKMVARPPAEIVK